MTDHPALRLVPGAGDGPTDSALTDTPSHDLAAEQATLGAMLLDPRTVPTITAVVQAGDFYRPAHGAIFAAILGLHAAGRPADAITVAGELRQAGLLDRVGGAPYLHTLLAATPSAASGQHYAEQVRHTAALRAVRELGTRLTQLSASAPGTGTADVVGVLGDAMDHLEASVTSLVSRQDTPRDPYGQVWDEPLQLSESRALAPFPVEALPGWVADMVGAVATETQTPPDLAGCVALSCLATAAGGRAVVAVRGRWREPVNLFVAVALPPANRKSAVFAAMLEPLLRAEQVLTDNAAAVVAEAETTARVARAAADRATSKAASCADGAERDGLTAEAVALTQAADAATIPPRPQLIADDATPETAASLLADQGGRLAILSAEGEIFDIIAGRYSRTPNMGVFLKGHAGDLLKVNRQTRREYIEHPALTIGVAIQPAVLTDIAKHKGFEGRGLLARFLYSLPASLLGQREILPDPIPETIADAYEKNLSALTLSLADWTDPAVIPLTPDADHVMVDFQRQVEQRLAPKGDLAHISTWAGKLPGAVARIAGLLHLASHLSTGWGQPITADTMTAAVAVGDYFTHHALAVFDHMGANPNTAPARTILARLREQQVTEVSRRELFNQLPRSQFPTVADLEPALRLLEDHGWLRRKPEPPRSGRGRPAAPRYLLHPDVCRTGP